MSLLLKTPTVPVFVDRGYLTQAESTLEIRCSDRFLRDATVCGEREGELYRLEGNGLLTSWSMRRSLKSASGEHLLDLRHYKSKLKQWIVEDPQGRELCIIKDSISTEKQNTAAEAQILSSEGLFSISMQSSDHTGITTVFQVEGIPFAEMSLVENNDISFLHRRGLDRTAWKLRLAAGVDVALVLALAFCRIEISHSWRR
ncbi:hypothetical protein K431DRAFT_168672 [Polychaeton citri CBS 116435]|uniref:Uncharacterized protein n=1 Tax=Polychaeton citri CBS 116435 TaxID=1314669 RepID=A0A9P4PXU4_9PEZI|nr:hypothetical protein K431DRAFT_168672 [Polychaeton citri CBS 116435]